jgi:hypothetical protein
MKKLAFPAVFALSVVGFPVALMPHETVTTTVTYDREIVRILKHKCIVCHSHNNLGPPFTTYEETRPWARDIEEQVLARNMPPWRAVPGYGQFTNDLGLTNRETQFLVSWVEGSGPKSKDQRLIENFGEGTPANGPSPQAPVKWELGKPDLTVSIPRSTAAGDTDLIRQESIDLRLTAESSIRALDYRPQDRRALRAVFFSIEETGQWLSSWTPWSGATVLPKNTAYRIPAGSHIRAEFHYQKAQESVSAEGSLGLYVAPAGSVHHPVDLVLETKPSAPSDSDGSSKLIASAKIPTDSHVLAIWPVLPQSIDSLEVSALQPAGAVSVLLLLRDALPDWPTSYVLSKPAALPRGTELVVTAHSRVHTKPEAVRVTISRYDDLPTAHVTARTGPNSGR